jgi:hypothetical protein
MWFGDLVFKLFYISFGLAFKQNRNLTKWILRMNTFLTWFIIEYKAR